MHVKMTSFRQHQIKELTCGIGSDVLDRRYRGLGIKIARSAAFAVLPLALFAQQQADTPSARTSPQATQQATSKPAIRPPKSIQYRNTKYGFTFSLPTTWKGYSVVEGIWNDATNAGFQGPQITLVNPRTTPAKQYQDIYILVFTHAQWDSLQAGDFAVSAASVGPGELGRNRKYVFAEPPRMIDSDSLGREEVVQIMHGHPLHAF